MASQPTTNTEQGKQNPVPDDKKYALGHNDYEYFFTFLNDICPAEEISTQRITQNILTTAMDIADICIMRPHDVDAILFKAASCAELLFSLSRKFEGIKMTTTVKDRKQPSNNMTKILASDILCSSKNIAHALDEHNTAHQWMFADILRNLQQQLDYTMENLLLITGTITVHKLLDVAIKLHVHPEVLTERLQHIQSNAGVAHEYEKKSCYPWKYYWNPAKSWFLSYICKCQPLLLGHAYPLSHLIGHVQLQAHHRISTHNYTEEEVKNELSHLLRLPPNEFDIKNQKSLKYAILRMTTPPTFGDTWVEKYKHLPIKNDHIATTSMAGCKNRTRYSANPYKKDDDYADGPGF